MTGDRVLRSRDVAARLACHRNTLWSMVKSGRFPKPRRITVGIHGWPESVVDEWIRTRPEVGGEETADA